MKQSIYSLLALLIIGACSNNKQNSINPDDHLTASQKDAVKTSIIRYVSKPSDDESDNDRFTSKHDQYYKAQANKCRLEFYTVKDDYHYFLVSLPAPSLTEKRHAAAGRFVLNEKGEMTEYEEIFRTWKMKPEVLKNKSEMLFKKLIRGESLERYYSKNAGDQYIEFPDDRTYFDKESRSWKFRD